MINQQLIIFLKKPRHIIILALLLAFFLPWISYGYIVKSGFDIPLYSEDLKSMVGFFTQGKQKLPEGIIYIYGLYIYPVLILLLLVLRSRVFSIFVALLPIVPFMVLYKFWPVNIIHYMGFGFMVTLLGSAALIVQSLLKKNRL